MNILPKKRWHVRTKDNIARVRRDEAEAAEQERKRVEKQEFAESEARLNVLRSQTAIVKSITKTETDSTTSKAAIIAPDGHVDLFSDYQSHIKTVNKEHEKEKKEEQEKYEKQIGYLTYLGQDTNEALKLRSWYEVLPNRGEVSAGNIVEKDFKKKYLHDPLSLIRKLLPEEKCINKINAVPTTVFQKNTPEVKKNKHKSRKLKKDKKYEKSKKTHKKHNQKTNHSKIEEEQACKKKLIDRLRRERLKREARERVRQEEILCPKVDKLRAVEEVCANERIVQKYNSQFNPDLAKQNMV